MDSKQNPFSLYDFLGYFTPGAIFLYSLFIIYSHIQYGSNDLFALITERLSFDRAEIYIPFVLAAYSIGHIISFISSIVVERYAIWSLGYPSVHLLGRKARYFDVGEKKVILRISMRILVGILILPVTFFDVLVGKWLGARDLYAKPLDRFLRLIIRAKILGFVMKRSAIEEPPADLGRDLDVFRFIYHWTVENAPHHLPKMQNYVALYGFLRTLTLLSIFYFWAIVWHAMWHVLNIGMATLFIGSFSLLSFILYTAFVKFYRRFTLESYMALCAVFENEKDFDLSVTKIDG